MSRIAHLLCDDGITGELLVAALVDAGADVDSLQSALDGAGLAAKLFATPGEVRSIRATQLRFEVDPDAPRTPTPAALQAAVDQAVSAAGLPQRAAARAGRIVTVLSEAEASVHGVGVEDVHFHEIGRPLTLVRIVALVAALEILDLDRLTVADVTVGGGTIQIAHGRVPVPAPVVMALLRGYLVVGGARTGELTTPSGAAALAALATPVEGLPRLRLETVGRGTAAQRRDALVTVMIGLQRGALVTQPAASAASIRR